MEVKSIIKYTVKDLIKELEKLPQDLPVVINGYESGYENIYGIKIKKVDYDLKVPYYEGQFQESENEGEESFEVVVIEREERS